MKRIIFFLVIFSIICYFQYNYINKNNNSYEILQYENPNKSIFENMLNDRLISIFTDINLELKTDLNIYPNASSKDKSYIEKELLQNINYYAIPFCLKTNLQINFYNKDQKIHLNKVTCYRNLIYQHKGTRRLFIFSPNQKNNLYSKNINQIDFWNQNTNRFPLLKNAKYIEIILRENQMIYIPLNWYYASICDDECITIFYLTESIFSAFLKKK